MNNNDFDDLVKKAQTMINNNQVPPEIAAMMKNMNINTHSNSNIGNNQNEDEISNLLEALKPYMRDSRKEKIDEYIKLVKMGKAAKLFNSLNNNNKF